MRKMHEINEIAEKICKVLKSNGFVIQRYNSYTTNSIYLKLDFGVCNSVRISDHYGKRYLKYRYNIGSFVKKRCCKKRNKFPMMYFCENQVNDLINQILKDKKEKIKRYGENNYRTFMEQNKKNNINSKGFWKQCFMV